MATSSAPLTKPIAQIRDTAYHLPSRVVTNDDLSRENPSWNMKRAEAQTGVAERHVVGEGETALDVAEVACRSLLDRHRDLPQRLDALLFCTQSPDHIMPGNACILHGRMEFRDEMMAFDFNLACSGYVYGLTVARGLIASGAARHVLLIASDVLTQYIHPSDGAMRPLFGDGAAASWISEAEGSSGILDVACSTRGRDYDAIIVPAGGFRQPRSEQTAMTTTDKNGNVRTLDNVRMDGMRVMAFVNTKVAPQIRHVLQRNGLTDDDVKLYFWHQASKLVLDSLARTLDVSSDKVYSNLKRIGNTTSASIPIALVDALEEGRCARGDLVLMCGFGTGLSWATALVRL